MPPTRAVHLSNAPEETYLLGLQLEHEGLDFDLTTVASTTEFVAALALLPAVVIADLPLPWSGADDELSELQRTRPDVPVVFRWGVAGSWSVEDAASQLGQSLRGALALGLDGEQSAEDRRLVTQEFVRYQAAHLRLQQIDTWEWHDALYRATEIMSEMARVERVSVWRFDQDHTMLECEALFLRSQHSHPEGGALTLDPSYRRAIENATFVAAHDAQQDPRTSAFAAHYLVPLGITSMLDAPIRCNGQVVGVVCLEHVGAARRWNVVEQCAAAAFASVVGRILEARDRRRIEEQLQQSRRLEMVGRMAGAIAHDFSNLATVIAGFSETVLADLEAGDPHREPLMAIHQAGTSATGLVRQLLAYTRQQTVDTFAIDLSEAVRNMHVLVGCLLGPEIRLTITTPPGPVFVRMELSQLQRIVLNLAANARDALGRRGAFRLDLDLPDAEDPEHPLGTARLRASDNGDGIPADVLPHVFEPLYTTRAERGGSGLGLSAVRAIVSQAGGTIAVESTPGRETTFTLVLPQTAADDAPRVAVAAHHLAPTDRPGTILVVDDDPAVRSLITRVLERTGYIVTAAGTPAEALSRTDALGPDLGLIITDLAMRDMSGAQLITRLRATRPDLPALLITGDADVPDLFADSPKGETRVLAKPFDIRTLRERVGELTHSRRH